MITDFLLLPMGMMIWGGFFVPLNAGYLVLKGWRRSFSVNVLRFPAVSVASLWGLWLIAPDFIPVAWGAMLMFSLFYLGGALGLYLLSLLGGLGWLALRKLRISRLLRLLTGGAMGE